MWTVLTTEAFDRWFSGLRDQRAARRIQARIDRAEAGNFGDSAPVGEGDMSSQARDIASALGLARRL